MSQPGALSCRHAFTRALLDAATADRSIVAVTSDARGSVTLDKFAEMLPEQFFEIGIAEQNTVGIAAGLARCGKRPFVCGPASFYSARAVEQIKNDVAYGQSNVKIVGVSGGVSYGALGGTHHSLHDFAIMRAIPNIAVLVPCDRFQTRAMTLNLASYVGPVYMRLGRAPVPDVYSEENAPFVFGKANLLRDGRDCTIIATGEAVFHALGAARELAQKGIHARMLDVPSVKPLDDEAILAAARDTGLLVTVEEHSVHGGLGSAVAELLCQRNPVPIRIIAFPDEFAPAGSSQELFEHYGLTSTAIAEAITSFLLKRHL